MALSNKLPQQAGIADRLAIRFSTSRRIDGLWVGAFAGPTELILRHIEEAIVLIKNYSLLDYSRIAHNLERVWVNLLPDARACYQQSLKACVLDERFVLDEATTSEQIAAAIIHEATHARLAQWGVGYDEDLRPRIEAICLRRELAFAKKLPNGADLQDELMRTLKWCATSPDYFSTMKFRERSSKGQVAALRYAGAPGWLIRCLMMMRSLIGVARRLFGR